MFFLLPLEHSWAGKKKVIVRCFEIHLVRPGVALSSPVVKQPSHLASDARRQVLLPSQKKTKQK